MSRSDKEKTTGTVRNALLRLCNEGDGDITPEALYMATDDAIDDWIMFIGQDIKSKSCRDSVFLGWLSRGSCVVFLDDASVPALERNRHAFRQLLKELEGGATDGAVMLPLYAGLVNTVYETRGMRAPRDSVQAILKLTEQAEKGVAFVTERHLVADSNVLWKGVDIDAIQTRQLRNFRAGLLASVSRLREVDAGPDPSGRTLADWDTTLDRVRLPQGSSTPSAASANVGHR